MLWRLAARASVPLTSTGSCGSPSPVWTPKASGGLLSQPRRSGSQLSRRGGCSLRFAGAVRDRGEVGELEAAAGMPLRVVRLVVSREQVDHRLTNDPTSGRHGDLEVAREWLTGGVGEGIEDRAVTNDGPIAAVATEILEWLSW